MSDKMSKKQQQQQWKKSMSMQRGLEWTTLEVEDIREKRGIKRILQQGHKHMKGKSTVILER